ncbi:MAG TPA: EF-hand domain-containing protein [Nannocystis sp.]|jgi:Ca2+-binding EF-hand superfamily protein
MNTISKIFLPIVLLFACDKEDTDNAEPNDAAVESNDGDRGHRGRGGLKKLDTDGDGMISQAEARDSRLADKFAELDADKDGKLSKDELHAMKGKGHDPAERAAHMLKKFDANNDGAITQAEVGDHPKLADKFAELDADKDGKLTSTELQAMRGPGHGGGHGKGHDKGEWHDMDPAQRAAKMMEKFDADKDGSLSAAELAEHPKLAGKFAEVDTDKDGKLSSAELTAFKAAHHGKGRGGPDGERGRGRGRGPDGDKSHG